MHKKAAVVYRVLDRGCDEARGPALRQKKNKDKMSGVYGINNL
jgi:hypothetical protein